MNLKDRIANIHLLVCSDTFRRWPLTVRFFAPDYHRTWESRVQGSDQKPANILQVVIDETQWPFPTTATKSKAGAAPVEPAPAATFEVPENIKSLDQQYIDAKPHVEKGRLWKESHSATSCSVCKSSVSRQGHLALICPHDGCHAASHVICLSKEFLRQENNRSAVLPTTGNCPSCCTPTKWVNLITELSLRTRGQAQVEKLFKVGGRSKKAGKSDADDVSAEEENDYESDAEQYNELAGFRDIEEFDSDNDLQPQSINSHARLRP